MKVAYATEAGLFQQAEIPTIVCGPGSIEQAHRANEYVEVEQLRLCEEFIINMLRSHF
ncbi:Acetylornithine deacetylase [Legionella pneumophila]|nr:Acetylornithine deacetylase [Legionella pneumophila]